MDCLIKWSGSKRSEALEIIECLPDHIETYYENFCGGCSVAFRLMSIRFKIKKYILSDVNKSLIDFYHILQKDPVRICDYYSSFHSSLKVHGESVYYDCRDRYNEYGSGLDLFCLSRTCFNGLIRYNRLGEFNVSFHHKRLGIDSEKMGRIVMDYHNLLNKVDVEFICRGYDSFGVDGNDFVYMDPPYFGGSDMYFGELEKEKFINYLSGLGCGWAVSLGKSEIEFPFPVKKIGISGVKSSYHKLVVGESVLVNDYLYMRD